MSGHVHAVAAHEEGQPLRGCPTHIVTATDANRSHVTKTEVAQHWGGLAPGRGAVSGHAAAFRGVRRARISPSRRP
jgi:hypothetical protein